MSTSDFEPNEPQPDPLPTILKALGRRIAATSLRGTAREVGLSATGLHSLVYQKVNPYGKTREKIALWYAKHTAAEPGNDGRMIGAELLTRRIVLPDLRNRTRDLILAIVDYPTPALLERLEAAMAEPEPAEESGEEKRAD